MRDEFDDKRELMNDGDICTAEKVKELEKNIEQIKEEIKQLKKLSKQREKLEKLEQEKKRLLSQKLQDHRRHHH